MNENQEIKKELKKRGRKLGQVSLTTITLAELVSKLPESANVIVGAKWLTEMGIQNVDLTPTPIVPQETMEEIVVNEEVVKSTQEIVNTTPLEAIGVKVSDPTEGVSFD